MHTIRVSRLLWISALCCFILSHYVQAQNPTPSPAVDVLRTNIELVQTDVTVVVKGARGAMISPRALAPNRIPPEVTKDQTRLPYWTEIPLSELPTGRYTLQVSATDRATNESAMQTVSFSVE